MARTHTSITAYGCAPYPRRLTLSELFTPYWRDLLIGFCFLLVTNAIVLFIPRLINMGIALVETERAVTLSVFGHRVSIMHVGSIVLLMTGSAILVCVFRIMSRALILNVGRKVEFDLRQMVFSHVLTLTAQFYRRHSVGHIMNHLTGDTANIRMSLGFGLLNLFNIVLMFVGTVPIMLSINWQVAIAALSPFPLVIAVAQLFSRRMYGSVREYQEASDKLTSHVQEALSAQQLIRVFHQQDKEQARFADASKRTSEVALNLANVRVIMFPLLRLMGGLGVALTLLVGGRAVAKGHMTVGDFVEVNTRLLQLVWPAISFGFVISVYQRGLASLVRMRTLLENQPTIVDGPVSESYRGSAELRDLSYTYAPGENNCLDNVSLSISPGQMLGIVGPSGSGKSTLIRILARQLDVESGNVFYDGIEAHDWNLKALLKHVGVVGEEPFLFSASIRDNICFGDPSASKEDMHRVSEIVGLMDEIRHFEHGFDTLVGEKGVMLSGGQRQRVALARALIRRPKLLLLDDCLSAVDAETQARIVASLTDYFVEKPSMIVVSHRLSVVQGAQEILLMEKGKIVGRGLHNTLIKTHPLYQALWGLELAEGQTP